MNNPDTVQVLAVLVGILAVAFLFLKLSLNRTMRSIDRLIGEDTDSQVLDYQLSEKAKETLDLSNLAGQDGIAITALKPSGRIEIRGKSFDARTEGHFLDKASAVRVIRAEREELVVQGAD